MPKPETKPSRMYDVYCRMKDLQKMDALAKCARGYESPPWVYLLLEASMKFQEVRRWLTDDGATTFDFKYPGADELDITKKYQIDEKEDTIWDFSESILMCQAFFPGPVVCCKHIIADMEHLNVICHHCRYFQMRILTLREARKNLMAHEDFAYRIARLERAREKDSSSDSDQDEYNSDQDAHKRRRERGASLFFVTQHTHVTRQNDTEKTTGRDDTDKTPSAPPEDRSQKAEEVPTARSIYNIPQAEKAPDGVYNQTYLPEQYHETKAKLEVQSLLRMLQNSPY